MFSPRRMCWIAFVLAAICSWPVIPPVAAAGSLAPKPSILFILTDDLGWGDLGFYGHPQLKTPHLDQLARQGTLFTQFYVNGSVCSPSRCAFMTSQFPARQRIHGHYATHEQNAARAMSNWMVPRVATLPSLLKKARYATAHFGKWHLGSGQGAPGPDEYGLDVHQTINANGPTWDEVDSLGRGSPIKRTPSSVAS